MAHYHQLWWNSEFPEQRGGALGLKYFKGSSIVLALTSVDIHFDQIAVGARRCNVQCRSRGRRSSVIRVGLLRDRVDASGYVRPGLISDNLESIALICRLIALVHHQVRRQQPSCQCIPQYFCIFGGTRVIYSRIPLFWDGGVTALFQFLSPNCAAPTGQVAIITATAAAQPVWLASAATPPGRYAYGSVAAACRRDVHILGGCPSAGCIPHSGMLSRRACVCTRQHDRYRHALPDSARSILPRWCAVK